VTSTTAGPISQPFRLHLREFQTTAAIVLNAVVGLVSQVVLASRIGPGWELDTFFRATSLPMAIVGISATAFGAVIIPALAHRSANGGDALELERRVIGFFLIAAVGIGIAGAGLTFAFPRIVGGSEDPRTVDALSDLLPTMWAFCAVSLLSQVFIVLHHVRRRFLVATMASSLLPASLLFGVLLLYPRAGIPSLAFAYLAGASVQLALLVLTLERGVWPRLAPPYSEITRIMAGAAAPVLAVLLNTVGPVSDAFWAAPLSEGALSYVGVCIRLTVAIAAIMSTGIAVVSFPNLAELAARGEDEAVRTELAHVLVRGLYVLLPIAALVYATREPLLGLLFERGAFSPADGAAIARILPYYLIGMVSIGCSNLVVRAFYALRETRPPAQIGVLSLILYIFISGVLSTILGVDGLGISYLVSWMILLLAQLHALGRRLGRVLDRNSMIHIASAIGGSLVAMIAADRVVSMLRMMNHGIGIGGVPLFRELITIVTACIAGAALYVPIIWVLGRGRP
jgi:putative peptidoglycan lipid II flippase